MALRVVFFGTPSFSAKILEALFRTRHHVVGVVSKPDKPKGRQQKLLPTAVKECLLESSHASVPFYQPLKASTEEFAQTLRDLKPDLFLVVAYGEIIKQNILDIPRLGCINIHASILPKYRGAAPIQRAILAGEKETGVTFMHMVLKMDAGDIIEVIKVPISPSDNFVEVESKLCEASCQNLEKILDRIASGHAERFPQDESLVTFADKITPDDLKINWAQSAFDVHNQVRAFSPRPGAHTQIEIGGEKKLLKIKRATVLSGLFGEPKATIAQNKNEWIVACGEGALRIEELQLEGKKEMSYSDFAKGISNPFHIAS